MSRPLPAAPAHVAPPVPMNARPRRPALLRSLLLAVLLAGCATAAHYSGHGLAPGQAREADVRAAMGEPALAFDDAGGRVLLYPRGPEGFHTFRVTLDGSGRLVGIENVLEPKGFARVKVDDDRETVRRTLGPPREVTFYDRRNEEVWEWRFCDDYDEAARFYAIFDRTSGRVKSTGQLTETQAGRGNRRVICSR
ncbi:hypothetical protein [Oryzomicrobium sp.]|uniref:hypothetical protein n=1 Tax=Oryzomicrobium sp. TaxID=1911578 RepID=UPI0025D1ADEE|nr:hypothetical protein [Oryzomicrobium sp.]MCE1244734.1 hypothetical protein [Oryzomicrobium sp.]